MNMKITLKICGIIIIIVGIAHLPVSLLAWAWEYARIEKIIQQAKWTELMRAAFFNHMIQGILSIIIGIGTLMLKKIAIYSLIPLCLYGIWFQMHINRHEIFILGLTLGYASIGIFAMIYLKTKNLTT